MSDTNLPSKFSGIDEWSDAEVKAELDRILKAGGRNRYARFFMAALGAIPWVGGVISGSSAAWAEREQRKVNDIHAAWMLEHENRIAALARSLVDVTARLSSFGEEVQQRVESEEYLDLVRKGFKAWNNSDTDEKRKLIQNLLANAGATQICSDDVVRMFIEWIDHYNEVHFKVIRVVYKNASRGIGRGSIWSEVYGPAVREDSAEADLFKLLIRDMSTGGIIRQHRATDRQGNFIKKSTAGRRKSSAPKTMKSAFDDNDRYVLTELGMQFVHYTMNEVVPRIEGDDA